MPRAAKIEAYSTPITPPPTTVIARGRRLRHTMSSLVIATSRSRAAPAGSAARVPTAITTCSAVTSRVPESPVTREAVLRYVTGAPSEEIASITRVSPEVVRKRVSRFRRTAAAVLDAA